jgi:hypothetical protein
MSALSCPSFPFKNVVCADYDADEDLIVTSSGFSGAAAVDNQLYVDVDLRAASRWCVTGSLRTNLLAIRSATANASIADVTSNLSVARKHEYDGSYYEAVDLHPSDQVQSVVIPAGFTGAYAVVNIDGTTDLSRGQYRFYGIQSADDEGVSSLHPVIAVQAIPVYSPGS